MYVHCQSFAFVLFFCMMLCTRWPLFCIRCAEIAGAETLHPLWQKIAWSMNVLLDGKHPEHDSNNAPWPEGSLGQSHAGKPLDVKGAMVMFRSDWKFLMETFHLSRHYSASQICHMCDANDTDNELSYCNVAANAPWRNTMKTTAAFITDSGPKPDELQCHLI